MIVSIVEASDGTFVYVQAEFTHLFGFSLEGINELGGFEALFCNSTVAEEIRSIVMNGYPWTGIADLQAADGTSIEASLQVTPIAEEIGEQVLGFVLFCMPSMAAKTFDQAGAIDSEIVQVLQASQMCLWRLNVQDQTSWAINLESVLGEAQLPSYSDFLNVVHPDDRAQFDEVLARSQTMTAYEFAFRYFRRNGQIVWIKSRGEVVFDEDGQPLYLSGTLTDITWRRHAQQLRQANHRRTNTLLKSLPEHIVCVGRDGIYRRIISSNPEFAIVFPKEQVGVNIYDVLRSELADRRMVYLQRSFVFHRPQTYEYQTVSADGQLYYLEERVVAIDAKLNGAATAEDEALILVRDITQHKQLEAALLVSQIELQDRWGVDRSLRNIGAEFRYAAFLKRMGGDYVSCNQAFARLVGRSIQEICGKSDFDLFSPKIAEILMQHDLAVLNSGKMLDFDEVFERDGQPRWCLVDRAPLYNEAGQLFGICGTAVEIGGV
ncbi:PAS domain S-box protein [Leptolyngbya sp. AN03gr2]|uniref:PAS domain S-box protein n=1 Tax=unclassified Leptolyngbya TaxID=2650499 RepID=UPI003D31DB58